MKVFVSVANILPDWFYFRFIKNLCLRISGLNCSIRDMYSISPFNIDSPSNIYIGKSVFINRNVTLEGQGKIIIGDTVQIGPNVVIATTNHELGSMDEIFLDVMIKKNVWIGANAVITPGITLGPNVIVGAGSVVTKNFSNCSIGGIPAKILK